MGARAGGIAAQTGLTLIVEKHLVDPASTGLPADPGSLFGGAEDPARAPTLVYPNDGALVPPNLGRLEVHFRRDASTDVFELTFSSATTDVTVYVSCVEEVGGGCIVRPNEQAWSIIAGSNRGTDPVTIRLRAASAAGGAIGVAAATRRLSFSADPVVGGLYYWTTSGSTAIMRYDFAGEQTQAEQFLSTEMTDGQCVGCHALSPSGNRMVTATNGSYDARSLLLDVKTKTPMAPYGTSRAAFASFAPDEERYVGTYAGDDARIDYDLNVFHADTGVALYSIPVGGTAAHPSDHPDWSPAGDKIAYVKIGTPKLPSIARFNGGSIWTVSEAAGGWGAPAELLGPLEHGNRYYPTYSPDSALLAFNQSTCPAGDDDSERCDAYLDPSARVFAMPAAGGTPVELAAANAPGSEDGDATELTSSFPKWAPFEFQRTSEESSRVMWITFSSSRAYGLRRPPEGGTLIWMAAVNPDDVGAGIDPSYPAFALPFQDVSTSNHTAQWARTVLHID